MSYARTNAEYRAQRCIEKDETLFAKQLRGEQYTEAESEYIAECAVNKNTEAGEAWANVAAGFCIAFAIIACIWGIVSVVRAEIAWKKYQKESDARHEALMKKLKEEYGEGGQ